MIDLTSLQVNYLKFVCSDSYLSLESRIPLAWHRICFPWGNMVIPNVWGCLMDSAEVVAKARKEIRAADSACHLFLHSVTTD